MRPERALLAAALLVTTGCVRAPAPPLRVGVGLWPGTEPLFQARDLGFASGDEVRIVEFADGPAMVRSFENGIIDVGAFTLDETQRLAEAGLDPRIVLVADVSIGADALVARPEIVSLRDLRGRRVGIVPESVAVYTAARSLDRAGLLLSDVVPVPVAPEEMEAAWTEGRVDAAAIYDPYRARLVAGGARILFDSSEAPGEFADVLVARAGTLERNADALRALCRSWFRGVEALQSGRADVLARSARRQGLEDAAFRRALEGIRFPDLAENRRLLSPDDATLAEAMGRLAEVLGRNGLSRGGVDPPTLLSDRFVAGVSP